MKKTLQAVSDTILDKSVTITVTIDPKSNIDKVLQKLKLKPKERVFHIRPLSFGTMIKISRTLLEIDIEIFNSGNFMDSLYTILDQQGESIAKIVAMAIVNRKEDPSDELVDFVMNYFTSEELLNCVMVVVKQMDLTSFMSSIVSMRGINLLQQTSQKVSGEIIASGKPSDQQ